MFDVAAPHAGFVIAAYGLALVTLAGLLLFVAVEYWRERRR